MNLLKHLLRSGTEEENESDKDSYLAVVLLLRVKDPVSLICHCWAVKSAGCANGPNTNKCSNTTASIASFFLHIGAVTVPRSKTNLIEALTNHL